MRRESISARRTRRRSAGHSTSSQRSCVPNTRQRNGRLAASRSFSTSASTSECGRSGGLAGDHLKFNLTGLHAGGLEGQEFLSPSLAPAAGRGQSKRDRCGASDLAGLLQDLCTRGKFIHSRGRPGIRGLKRRIRTRPDAFELVRPMW
jgi:hypothetical protein